MSQVEVIVCAGIPGKAGSSGDGEHRYPADTSDFVKLLREQGLVVSYEHEKNDRTLVNYQGLELWIPILDFSNNVLANIPANIMASTIMNYFGGSKPKADASVLHVKYKVRNKKGEVVEFEADGLGRDANIQP